MPGFRDAIITYVRKNANPPEKFSHQVRLYELTRRIGADMEYDDNVVFAAAWLHDIGVFIGHRPEAPEALANWDMLAYAVKVVPGILEAAEFPPQKVPAVLDVIRTHQPAAAPTKVEGLILRDADILELLGATGILRTVCKIGRDTRFHTFEDALAVLRQNLETLPTQLQLAASRKLAVPRIEQLRVFLNQATSEGLLGNGESLPPPTW
jgi:uncharacterized protein